MITPALQFRTSDYAKGWQDLVDSDQFERAASTALLQMELNQPAAPDLATAAAWHWRMAGAKDYLRILMSLAEQPTAPPSPLPQNLDHTA